VIKAEETRGFMAPINAAAWTQNRPEKTAAATQFPEAKPAEINAKKEEEKKAPVILENRSGGNFNGNIRPAFLPKRQEIEINLISGEGQVKELTPRAKVLLLTAVTAGLILIFGVIFFIIDTKVKEAMAEKVTVESQITELNKKIKEAGQNSKAVSELQPQLNGLKKVLENHPQARKLFDYLEANTALGIYYTDLGVEVENGQVSLEGVALDYNQVAQQFLIFDEDQKNIKEVELSGISKKEEQLTEAQKKRGETPRELVSFSLKITLADDFFKQ
jgi:Tfp pilus assembly protein PilN